MSIRLSRAWQMKHRGVMPSMESVILAFPWVAVVLVSAFVASVELFAPPDCDAPVKVAKHRRLLILLVWLHGYTLQGFLVRLL